MELMDWKQIETQAEAMIKESETSIIINRLILDHAKMNIIKMGGKTNAVINAEAKRDRDKLKSRTTK